ncbi:MAG: transketolase, partial [Eubacterium sp.]|nr:transketolase [Eubacterium sp.]
TRKYQTNGVRGVEMSAGSLGHGAGMGAGMAYAKRCQGLSGNVYVLMGDGECNEGSVWEAAMFASKFQLSNLVLIVDRNRLQSYGSDKEVMDMGDMGAKFAAFGCQVMEIDGHDYNQIYRALMTGVSRNPAKPTVIIANTVKGKGASFMENRLEWHFKSPNDEQLQIILEEQGI